MIFVLSNLRFVSIFGQCWVEDQHKRGNDILTSQLGLEVAPVTPPHFTCAKFNVDEQKIGHHWPFTF